MSFFALFHTGVGLAGPGRADDAGAGRAAGVWAWRGRWPCGRPRSRWARCSALVEPGLWSAVVARGAHGVLHNSLFRSGYELLFTPVAERRKRPTKAIVDVGFDRLGTVVGGLLMLARVARRRRRTTRACSFALAAGRRRWPRSSSRGGCTAATSPRWRTACARAWCASTWPTSCDSTTLDDPGRTGFSADREAILRDIMALPRRAARRTRRPPRPATRVPQTVADLRSGDPERQRRALRRPEAADPALVGHLIPLLAGNDLFLDVLRVLRRSAPAGHRPAPRRAARPAPGRRRAPPHPARAAGTPTQRAVDGLLLGPPRSAIRGAAPVRPDPGPHHRARALARRARATTVFAAVVRELEAAPAGWSEEPDVAVGRTSRRRRRRPRTPAERGLSHVFTLLSLVVEREPLQIAYWAVLGDDAGPARHRARVPRERPARGRARAPSGRTSARAPRPPAPSRTRQQPGPGPDAVEREPRPQPGHEGAQPRPLDDPGPR